MGTYKKGKNYFTLNNINEIIFSLIINNPQVHGFGYTDLTVWTILKLGAYVFRILAFCYKFIVLAGDLSVV